MTTLVSQALGRLLTSFFTCNAFEYTIQRVLSSQTILLNLEKIDLTFSSLAILNNSYTLTSELIRASFILVVPSYVTSNLCHITFVVSQFDILSYFAPLTAQYNKLIALALVRITYYCFLVIPNDSRLNDF